MKIPLSWLKEFIEINSSPHQIADLLTSVGLEVDGVETTAEDTIFEISLTPNLNHCNSVIGVARELAAITGQPLKKPVIAVVESKEAPPVKVTIEDKKGCPRYACRLIKEVKIRPSPEWMQKRLQACGVRPISNIVDITNYVLMECGHPMHAFDYDKLEGQAIHVRSAKDGESFVTLDGKERSLKSGDILICDAKRPVALGGIMGGENTEVSDSTVNVLLEAAYFNPSNVRKTSKRLGLQTDGSRRFERGADPNGQAYALNKAASLMHECADGKVCAGIVDISTQAFPEKVLTLRLNRTNEILGTQLSVSEVENVFQRLNFPCRWDGNGTFSITVPTYRTDITIEIDLIEEVARIYGYNNIAKASTKHHTSALPHSPMFLFEREVRARLLSEGLQEFMTCDLIGPTLSNIVKEHLMPEEAIVKVLNPTSVEQSILRTTLLPGLLQTVQYNIDHQNLDISAFEIGRIHFKEGEHFEEETTAAIIMTGKSRPHFWGEKSQEVDFLGLKGKIENLLAGFGIKEADFKASTYETFHTGRQASIYVGDLELGSMGEIHPRVLRRLGISQRIMFAEISLHALMHLRKKTAQMQPLPIYPSSGRDWTITLKEQTSVQELLNMIKSLATPILEDVSLIDIYRSEKLGKDVKNATLHFIYRDTEKTIEQEAVDHEHKRIVDSVLAQQKKKEF